jgi:hypothetical protein
MQRFLQCSPKLRALGPIRRLFFSRAATPRSIFTGAVLMLVSLSGNHAEASGELWEHVKTGTKFGNCYAAAADSLRYNYGPREIDRYEMLSGGTSCEAKSGVLSGYGLLDCGAQSDIAASARRRTRSRLPRRNPKSAKATLSTPYPRPSTRQRLISRLAEASRSPLPVTTAVPAEVSGGKTTSPPLGGVGEAITMRS